jgi:hypothetical protein
MAYGKPVGSLVLQSEQSFTASGRAQLRLEGGLTRRNPYGKTPRKTARKTLAETHTRGTQPIGGEQGPTAVGREAHGGTERPPFERATCRRWPEPAFVDPRRGGCRALRRATWAG